jgi:capsular exopolysaccharide synthesis family protein
VEIQTIDTQPVPDVRAYAGMLNRRKWWIIATTLVVGVVAFANAARHEPHFRATAEVLVSTPLTVGTPVGDPSLSLSAERRIRNEMELLESRSLREAAWDRVGHHVSVVAHNPGDSDVISLTVTGTDAEAAARDVNAFTDAYAEVRTEQEAGDLQEARDERAAQRRQHIQQQRTLRAPLEDINRLIAQTDDLEELNRLTAARDAELERTADAEQQNRETIGRLETEIADIDSALQRGEGVITVITEATVPSDPYFPQPKKDLLVGLAVGLLAGLALAFVREFADDRIVTEDDLERTLPEVPLLAVIPELDVVGPVGPFMGQAEDDRAPTTEAYRSLAASVEFASLGKPITVIHVTSAVAAEGKSTTAANLAVAFAETGTRVAVIDADLRRPQLHKLFDVPAGPGLSAILTRRAAVDDALQPVEGLSGLRLLAPGSLPANPTKLLHAQRTEELFDELRAEFDVVIIDGPPLLPVADSLILTQFADLVLLVVRSNKSGRRVVAKARKALRRVDAGTTAAVLNRVHRSGPDGYDYYYGHYEMEPSPDR